MAKATSPNFPDLDPEAIVPTRDALHAYAAVLEKYLETLRPWRKHWWHISLRPSLNGMTTGVIRASGRFKSGRFKSGRLQYGEAAPGHLVAADFELELDPARSLVHARAANGNDLSEQLRGQPAAELAESINEFLAANGLDPSNIPAYTADDVQPLSGYSPEIAARLAAVWRTVDTAMERFRAGIREETSPVQLWPHHFDLAMMWLPGQKIPGHDPDDEENADMQMNFGFTFGDAGIPEPYFYITAYPLPDVFPTLPLPAGTTWHSEDFSGAVLLYRTLVQSADPDSYLQDLWNRLLSAGREHLLAKKV